MDRSTAWACRSTAASAGGPGVARGRPRTRGRARGGGGGEPFYFRTWVERYEIRANAEAKVESPNGGINGFTGADEQAEDVLRSFFVPKLCNHCDNPPCVQVCPVGATFKSEDGVVLVDEKYYLECRLLLER